MALTHEDKLEITQLISKEIESELSKALELDRARARERAIKERAENPPAKPEEVTKTYLVTFSGHQIAFPAEHGAAVMHQAVYARVTRQMTNWGGDSFKLGDAVAIAYSDGRQFPKPIPIVLFGSVAAMVEVDEAMFKEKTMSA